MTKHSPQSIYRIYSRVPRKPHDTRVDQCFDSVRPKQAKIPGYDSSPVMANQEDLVDTQMVNKANKVTNDVKHGVGGGGGRSVSVTISTEVWASGAMQRQPWEERERSWWRHEYQSSGKPWRKRITGPVPIDATCMLMPFAVMVVCSIFSIDCPLSNLYVTLIVWVFPFLYFCLSFFFFFKYFCLSWCLTIFYQKMIRF